MEEQNIKFREVLRGAVARHFRFEELWKALPAPEHDTPLALPYRKSYRFLWLLEIVPWISLVAFGIGMFWDFGPEDFVQIGGHKLSLNNLIKTLSVSGLIGYGTNWLAIKMLFKPQKRRPIWGQGLIPAQKVRISDKLAFAIHHHVFNENYIHQWLQESQFLSKFSQILVRGVESMLQDPEFLEASKTRLRQGLTHYFQKEENRKEFIQQLDKKLKDIFKKGFTGFVFKSYTRLQPGHYQAILDSIVQEIPDTVMELVANRPEALNDMTEVIKTEIVKVEKWFYEHLKDILANLNLREVFRKQIHSFDEGQLEEMIWGATNEQLRYIRDLGGVLGIVGGLLIWQPIWVAPILLVTVGILWALDELLATYFYDNTH